MVSMLDVLKTFKQRKDIYASKTDTKENILKMDVLQRSSGCIRIMLGTNIRPKQIVAEFEVVSIEKSYYLTSKRFSHL